MSYIGITRGPERVTVSSQEGYPRPTQLVPVSPHGNARRSERGAFRVSGGQRRSGTAANISCSAVFRDPVTVAEEAAIKAGL